MTSALLLGLAGGPHCAVMCGALQAGVARRSTPRATTQALVSLHLGRLVGYTAAGALVAVSVSALSSLGSTSSWLRPVWTMLQVAAVAFGCTLMVTGSVPAWVSGLRWPRAPAQALTPAVATVQLPGRLPSALKAAGAGACWAAMPCGLLQSALIVAALANTAAQGAGVMGAFAVGTSVSLLLVGSAWARLGRSGLRWARVNLSVRLAGALLAVSSAFALFHGLGSALDQILCLS